jgi:battenin
MYINDHQGVAPTLLFPLEEMPFKAIRDAYPTYQTLYQLGVFISRSSSIFIRIHNIYLPSILQFCILCFLILQSLFVIIPSIYPLFVIIFCEGILGGLVYINAFHEVHDREHANEDREFALGAGMSLPCSD